MKKLIRDISEPIVKETKFAGKKAIVIQQKGMIKMYINFDAE